MPKVKIEGYIDIPDDVKDRMRYASIHLSEIQIENMKELDPEDYSTIDNKEKHPSFGMISVSRTCCSDRSLFGSSILNDNTIHITLRTASRKREHHNDYYYGEQILADIEMSQAQFADMITSMNVGNGVPCTLKWLYHKNSIEAPEYNDVRAQFEQELNDNIKQANNDANALINNIDEIFKSKKSFTKKDRDGILNMCRKLYLDINNNREFIYTQFNEQMDKTTHEAKCEIEAFAQNRIIELAKSNINILDNMPKPQTMLTDNSEQEDD